MCAYSSSGFDEEPKCEHCGFKGDKEKHFGALVHLVYTKGKKFSSSVKNSAWICLKCFGTIPTDQLIMERKDDEHFPVTFSYLTQILDINGQPIFMDFYFTEETIAKFFPKILERMRHH